MKLNGKALYIFMECSSAVSWPYFLYKTVPYTQCKGKIEMVISLQFMYLVSILLCWQSILKLFKVFHKILGNFKKMLFLLTLLCASSLATADASVTSRKFKGKIWLLKNVASKLDLFISKWNFLWGVVLARDCMMSM